MTHLASGADHGGQQAGHSASDCEKAFQRFHQAVLAIARADSFEQAFDLAVDAALEMTGSDSALVAVLRDGRLQMTRQRNVPQRALELAQKADWTQTFIAPVLESGKPVAFTPRQAAADPDLRGGHPGGGAICAAPAVHAGKVLGIIGVRRSEDRPYGAMEMKALAALGAVVGAVAATQAAKEAAARAQGRYSAILRWLPGTAYVLRCDGTVAFLSDNFQRVSGLPSERYVGKHFSELVHPDDARRLRRVLRRALDHPGETAELDYRVRTASGRWALRRATVGPLYGPKGELEGFIGFARDVSEEEARRRVLEAVPKVYAAIGGCKDLAELHRRAAQAVVEESLAGFAAIWLPCQECGGAILQACYADGVGWIEPETTACVEGLAATAARSGQRQRGELGDEPAVSAAFPPQLRGRIGLVWAEAAGSPEGVEAVLEVGFFADDPVARLVGEHLGVLAHHLAGAVREMKVRGALEEAVRRLGRVARELEEKTRLLEEANAELEGFVYVASHDLKAPLTSISGMAALLERHLRSTTDERALHYIARIRANVDHLAQMIEDLLELSRVGRIEGPVGDVYVDQVVEEVLKMFEHELADVEVKRPAGWPVVRVSRTRLHQVFANLVSNAIKYGCRGEEKRIELGWDDRGEQFEFFVRDWGPGIAPEYQQAIFRLFERGEAEDSDGSGIGLALVQKIVRHFGGRVWVESEPGRGATFRFTLPKPGGATMEVKAA